MPIFFGTLGGCCQGELQTERRVSCANALVLFVALAALAAAVIGILAVAAHLPHGMAGLGAISELGLPGGVFLTTIGLLAFIVFATLLVKGCCSPRRGNPIPDVNPTRPNNPVPSRHATYYKKAHNFFHQEYENRKSLLPNPPTALVKAPAQPTPTQVVNEGEKTIAILPDEIWVAILEYLNDKDILSFALTNKKHYTIAMDGLLKFFSIRVYLRKQVITRFHKQAFDAKNSTLVKKASYNQQDTAMRMVPFCAKTMLKETQDLLDTLETIERKTEALRFIAYSLGGMIKADPQIAIPQVLRCLDIAFKWGSEGTITVDDVYAIVHVISGVLAADVSLLTKCEEYLENQLLSYGLNESGNNFDDEDRDREAWQLREVYLRDLAEALISLDKDDVALKYLDKMELYMHQFLSQIAKKHLKNNNKEAIIRIMNDIVQYKQEKFIEPACVLARCYVFLGEFKKACAVQNKVKFHSEGHLITAIADQCDPSDPKFLENLLSLLEWTKANLESGTINSLLFLDDLGKKQAITALIRALTTIIKKIGQSDPIIDELIDQQKDNTEALEMISLCLIQIDLKKSCEIAEKILDPDYKTTTLITLAKEYIKSNKALTAKLLLSDIETDLIKANQTRVVELLQAAFKTRKGIKHKTMSIVESSLFEMAELYAQIGLLDKAEEIFELARQEAETENGNRLYAYLLPLIKTYITIEKARKRFNEKNCIDLINTLIGTDDDTAHYFARLADLLTLYH